MNEDMNYQERLQRLDELVAERRIIRNDWTGTDANGRELACLLAALSPEAGRDEDSSSCPASVMPAWLAHLTPDIDDEVSGDAWWPMVQRYARAAHAWPALDDAAWRRVLARTMIATLDIAKPHDPSGSCAAVSALWMRVMDGDEPARNEWAAAWKAAEAAAAWKAAWKAAAAAAWDAVADALLTAIEEEVSQCA